MKTLLLSRGFWLCVLLSLSMGSCKHGCNFTTVVKSKSKTEKIGKQNVTLTASLLKSRNIRYSWRERQFSRSSASYSVTVIAVINTNDLHLDWYFSSSKGADLRPYLKKTSLQKKSDNRYFTLNYSEEKSLTCLYQTMPNGVTLSSPYQQDFLDGKYKLESLPSDQQFKADLINKPDFHKESRRHQHLLSDYFNSLELTENECIVMLTHFENEQNMSLAKSYFTEEKLKQLKYKYPKFREKALAQALNAIETLKGEAANNYYIYVLLALGEHKAFERADKAILARWGDSFSGFTDNYVQTRLADTKMPMNKALQAKFEGRCKTAIDLAIVGKSYSSNKDYVTLENAMRVMVWTSNKAYLDKYSNFLVASLKPDDDAYKFGKIVNNPSYKYVSNADKQKIMALCKEQFTKMLSNDSEKMQAAQWYRLLKRGGASCSEMKTCYKQYKDKFKDDLFLDGREPEC